MSGKSSAGAWHELPTTDMAVVSGWEPPITGDSVTMRFTPKCEHDTSHARVMSRDVYEVGKLPRVEHRVECKACGALYEMEVVFS